jgi:zinc transport system permease protein
MLDFFADYAARYPFFLPSFAVGLLVAVLCAVLSVYVVLRRMAFIGQGISHAAFGGLAIGLFLFPAAEGPLDLSVYLVAVLFCLANAAAIGVITRRTVLSEDTAIGILFVLSMALGAIFFGLQQGRLSDLFSYLFGSVVAVTWRDVLVTFGLTILVLLLIGAFYKELQFLCFDEESARVAGLRTGLLNHLLLGLLSLTIVVAIKIVGVILVSAALVLPAATARLLCRSFGAMMVISVIFGILATALGLLAANFVSISVPAGAAVVIVQSLIFALVWLASRVGAALLNR